MILLMVVAVVAVFLSGCDEDSDPVAPAEEHFEAHGMLFRSSGAVIMRVFEGEIDPEIADEFEAGVGTGDAVYVTFLDEDGDEIDPPDDSDKALGWSIGDDSLLDILQHTDSNGNVSGESRWEFHFVGLEEGETTIEFQVLHVGHADFRTPAISVHIHGEASGDHDHENE